MARRHAQVHRLHMDDHSPDGEIKTTWWGASRTTASIWRQHTLWCLSADGDRSPQRARHRT